MKEAPISETNSDAEHRMGTSVAMIDRTYGHLAAGADDYERELLDAYDARSAAFRRCVGAGTSEAGSENG